MVAIQQSFQGSCCFHHQVITVKLDTRIYSETSVNFYHTVWRHIPEGSIYSHSINSFLDTNANTSDYVGINSFELMLQAYGSHVIFKWQLTQASQTPVTRWPNRSALVTVLLSNKRTAYCLAVESVNLSSSFCLYLRKVTKMDRASSTYGGE